MSYYSTSTAAASSSTATGASSSSNMSSSSTRSLYRQYSNPSSCSENLPPRTLARVARELRNLHKNPPEGVRLIVDGDDDDDTTVTTTTTTATSSTSVAPPMTTTSSSSQNLEQILCEMQGPVGTPYEGRCFVLKLTFTQDFPSAPPRGFFLTKIYHPNVDPQTGAICVNTLKKDWTAETTLGHVLAVIRCLLIVPFPESSLNDEAGKLFMESYQEYAKRARLMAQVHGRVHHVVLAHPAEEKPAASNTGSLGGGKEEPLSAVQDPSNNSPHQQPQSGDETTDQDEEKSLENHFTSSTKSSKSDPHSSSSNNSHLPHTSVAKALRNSDNNKKVTKLGTSHKMSKKKSLKRL